MDRNLGASRAANAKNDYQAYGCLYQWGRGNDGHASITYTMGQEDGWGTNAVNYLAEMLEPVGAEILEPVYIKGLPDEETISDIYKLADTIAEKHKDL